MFTEDVFRFAKYSFICLFIFETSLFLKLSRKFQGASGAHQHVLKTGKKKRFKITEMFNFLAFVSISNKNKRCRTFSGSAASLIKWTVNSPPLNLTGCHFFFFSPKKGHADKRFIGTQDGSKAWLTSNWNSSIHPDTLSRQQDASRRRQNAALYCQVIKQKNNTCGQW